MFAAKNISARSCVCHFRLKGLKACRLASDTKYIWKQKCHTLEYSQEHFQLKFGGKTAIFSLVRENNTFQKRKCNQTNQKCHHCSNLKACLGHIIKSLKRIMSTSVVFHGGTGPSRCSSRCTFLCSLLCCFALLGRFGSSRRRRLLGFVESKR